MRIEPHEIDKQNYRNKLNLIVEMPPQNLKNVR
jgi:hypothetical protein